MTGCTLINVTFPMFVPLVRHVGLLKFVTWVTEPSILALKVLVMVGTKLETG
jgi:hypothetical protein